jgi:hypothetical protein
VTENILQEKKSQLKEFAGDTVLRGEEFKRYVTKLRGRSSVYKRNRAELSALKAEAGVLTRTVEILRAQDEAISRRLVCLHTEVSHYLGIFCVHNVYVFHILYQSRMFLAVKNLFCTTAALYNK